MPDFRTDQPACVYRDAAVVPAGSVREMVTERVTEWSIWAIPELQRLTTCGSCPLLRQLPIQGKDFVSPNGHGSEHADQLQVRTLFFNAMCVASKFRALASQRGKDFIPYLHMAEACRPFRVRQEEGCFPFRLQPPEPQRLLVSLL